MNIQSPMLRARFYWSGSWTSKPRDYRASQSTSSDGRFVCTTLCFMCGVGKHENKNETRRMYSRSCAVCCLIPSATSYHTCRLALIKERNNFQTDGTRFSLSAPSAHNHFKNVMTKQALITLVSSNNLAWTLTTPVWLNVNVTWPNFCNIMCSLYGGAGVI